MLWAAAALNLAAETGREHGFLGLVAGSKIEGDGEDEQTSIFFFLKLINLNID